MQQGIQGVLIILDDGFSPLSRHPGFPHRLLGALTFAQESLDLIGPHRALGINRLLEIPHKMGMTELVGSRLRTILSAPAIMDEHSLITLRKMLLNGCISAPTVNGVRGGLRRLPDPLPELFPPDMCSGFI